MPARTPALPVAGRATFRKPFNIALSAGPTGSELVSFCRETPPLSDAPEELQKIAPDERSESGGRISDNERAPIGAKVL